MSGVTARLRALLLLRIGQRIQFAEDLLEQLALTRDALARLDALFPAIKDRGYAVAGFGWPQGWNNRINDQFNAEDASNFAHFVRDIRRELKLPNLPFVIAATGMTGPGEKHPRALSRMKAQASVAEMPEFKGHVAFVGTKSFWRAKEVSPKGQGDHWNCNAETYCRIGEAMSEAMKQLCPPMASAHLDPAPGTMGLRGGGFRAASPVLVTGGGQGFG